MFEDIKTTSGIFNPSEKADIQRKIAAQLYYSTNSGDMYVYLSQNIGYIWLPN
jgi:hypothetical protein